MKICFYFPSLQDTRQKAIFGSMYDSFFSCLESNGLLVKFATKLDEIEGDILVVSIGSGGEKKAAEAMHLFKKPVILNIYNAYLGVYKSFLKRWRSRILFAYCADFATLNYTEYASVQIPYYHIPFGSDENVFYPISCEKKYDITFMGNADSGSGREKYIKLLIKYAKENNLNLFLAGAGWEKYGYPYRIVKHGEETNKIYNETKICINLHNNRQYAGIDKEMDANNRLFDLAMAGACQITNGEKMVERYFSKDEVITADKPEEWIKKINSYLNDESEREAIGKNARKRALKEHTWNNRAIEFIQILNENYSDYGNRSQRIPIFTSFFRFTDRHIIPPYRIKEIRIIRYILIKLGLYNKK